MADVKVTLDDAIDDLDKQHAAMETLWADPGGNDRVVNERRKIIEFQLSRLTGKRLALAEIRAERGAASVTVTEISEAEKRRVEGALEGLGEVVQEDQTFNSALSTITTALAGASEVIDFMNAH